MVLCRGKENEKMQTREGSYASIKLEHLRCSIKLEIGTRCVMFRSYRDHLRCRVTIPRESITFMSSDRIGKVVPSAARSADVLERLRIGILLFGRLKIFKTPLDLKTRKFTINDNIVSGFYDP